MSEQENNQANQQPLVGGGRKVLIVEDDRFLLEIYATKLKNAGFEVEIAQDGESALSKIKEFKPVLLLLDIVLPKMDGFEVIKALKENPDLRDIKIIALTNLGQQNEVEKGLSLGAEDYFIKAHFTPGEIVFRVNKFLQEHGE